MLIERMERWHECAIANNVVQDIKDSADAITWLERQGEHANFCNKIQIGDEVTRNEDGILVNLSQFERVVKKQVKKDEQKSTDIEDNEVIIRNYDDKDAINKCCSWLKSIKERLKGSNK